MQSYNFSVNALTKVSEEDQELWAIIDEIPRLEDYWPYVVLIANCVLPGTGTLLTSCIGFPSIWSKTWMVVGLLQMATAFFIIGWIWSIWWGIKVVKKATEEPTILVSTTPIKNQTTQTRDSQHKTLYKLEILSTRSNN